MYACQFYNKMEIDLNDVPSIIERGDFSVIKAWLNENIHQQGRLYSPEDLALKVTGQTLNPAIFINYLKNKYNAIYQLN